MRNDPDMPSWAISVSPLSRANRRYLARRATATIDLAVSRSAKRGGNGKRMSGRLRSTRRIRAPSIAGSRPRRTVSTSGSSGMGMVPDDGEEGRAIFLQLDGADAVQAGKLVQAAGLGLRHFDQRPVRKNDISRLLLRRGDRAPQGFERGEKLGVRIASPEGRASRPARFRADDIFAQREGRFAAQNPASFVRNDESVAVVLVSSDQPRRLQLAQDAAPVGGRPVLADAERLQLVVPMPRHRLRRLARKDIGEMAEEEPSRRAQYRGKRLLRFE